MNAAGSTTHQEYFGEKATRQGCLKTCIGKIQLFPGINRVTYNSRAGHCFCKMKMVDVIPNTVLESCKLISRYKMQKKYISIDLWKVRVIIANIT